MVQNRQFNNLFKTDNAVLSLNLHLHEMIMSAVKLDNAMIGANTVLYLHRKVVIIGKVVIDMIGSNTASFAMIGAKQSNKKVL